MRSQTARIGCMFAAALVVPNLAGAQIVATSFEELQTLLKPGDTIYVTESSGRTTKGRLGELSATSVELMVRKTAPDGQETFVPQVRLSEANIHQIRRLRRDSLLNGALIGFAIGAGPWLFVQAASGGYGEPGGEHLFLWAGLFAGATGAGIGTAIDALMTQRVMVYYASPANGARVQLAPSVSKSAAALNLFMRF